MKFSFFKKVSLTFSELSFYIPKIVYILLTYSLVAFFIRCIKNLIYYAVSSVEYTRYFIFFNLKINTDALCVSPRKWFSPYRRLRIYCRLYQFSKKHLGNYSFKLYGLTKTVIVCGTYKWLLNCTFFSKTTPKFKFLTFIFLYIIYVFEHSTVNYFFYKPKLIKYLHPSKYSQNLSVIIFFFLTGKLCFIFRKKNNDDIFFFPVFYSNKNNFWDIFYRGYSEFTNFKVLPLKSKEFNSKGFRIKYKLLKVDMKKLYKTLIFFLKTRNIRFFKKVSTSGLKVLYKIDFFFNRKKKKI